MMNREFVAKELERRYQANETWTLDVTMKCGDKISIEWEGDARICVWFSTIQQLAYAKNWLEVADWMIAHPQKQNELVAEEEVYVARNEPELRKFFEEHIKGHINAELNYGNSISSEFYDMWSELDPEVKKGVSYVYDEKLIPHYLKMYAERHPQCNMDKVKRAFEFAEDFQYYSDWHKDVRGYRPRSLSIF